MQIDIIKLAELATAVSLLIGFLIVPYKLYNKATDKFEELERRIFLLEVEVKRTKNENALIIYALRACLNGLQQKGCNGEVSEAYKTIDRYLNKAAHDQD